MPLCTNTRVKDGKHIVSERRSYQFIQQQEGFVQRTSLFLYVPFFITTFALSKTKEEIMNKIISIMIAMLMSISLSSFAGTTTSTAVSNKAEKVSVPANIIVKQTITFDDGKTIEVFYEKKGQDCKLYSTADISKYGMADLYRIKSTNFEKANHVEGKCYATRTVKALIAMARNFLK